MARRTKPRTAAVVGVATLGVFAAAMGLAATANRGLPFATTTTVKAAFHEVGSLRVGDDVRIASVRVGQVDRIDPGDGQVLVTMHLDGNRDVYQNATAAASVSARSSLEQKFVELKPGTPDAGLLGSNDVVPVQNTVGAQELADLFPIFDEPTRQGLRTTLRETGGGLAGHEEDLHDLIGAAPRALPALGTVTQTLAADGGARLTALMRSTDRLVSRFAGRQEEISALLGSMRGTLDAVAVDRSAPLEETLDVAPAAMRDVRGALDTLNGPLADTAQAMADLRPGGEALGVATPDLRGVFREAVTPLDKVPGVADTAEPAFSALTPAMVDLRPVSIQLTRTLELAAPTVGVLAPYSADIAQFFTAADSALSGGDAAGHWLRIVPLLGSASVSGAGPVVISDPTTHRDPYPEPNHGRVRKTGGN